jgi:hypothetical protein
MSSCRAAGARAEEAEGGNWYANEHVDEHEPDVDDVE